MGLIEHSLKFFSIGSERMPMEVILAIALIKKAAALVNCELGKLEREKAEAIVAGAEAILAGKLDEEFPLFVWQAGGGTHSNMNVNEVIARIAKVHPNDHVNMSQSSNDVFPSAMHIAAVLETKKLIGNVRGMREALGKKSQEFAKIVKVGRTHLMDATPLTLGQEFSGYEAQVAQALKGVEEACEKLYPLAIGATAVGTGLNTTEGYAEKMAAKIAKWTGEPFVSSSNKFASLACHDPIVSLSGALKTLAVACLKIANDLRFLASGPRCGLAELFLPENEPGSSIMPGKVNPTQCEVMIQVACQVIGNDSAITMGGALGNFELNVSKPLIIYNLLQSIRLLSDCSRNATLYLINGIKANKEKLQYYLDHSLMLVTALSPLIGYDKSAEVARLAAAEALPIKAAALKLGVLTEEELTKALDPISMLSPERSAH